MVTRGKVLVVDDDESMRVAEQRPVPAVTEEATRFLKRHEWPGNVRELINALEYAVVTCEGNAVGPSDLPYGDNDPESQGLLTGGAGEEGQLARQEMSEILKALKQFRGNKTKTAEYLGINRKTLREKLRKIEDRGTEIEFQ